MFKRTKEMRNSYFHDKEWIKNTVLKKGREIRILEETTVEVERNDGSLVRVELDKDLTFHLEEDTVVHVYSIASPLKPGERKGSCY